MTMMTGLTRGGTEWTPSFILELQPQRCIGCGRCFKVCPREVFMLVERSALDDAGSDDDPYADDYDDGFDDDSAMVMSLAQPLECIGCEACLRVCPNKCMSHAPQALPS